MIIIWIWGGFIMDLAEEIFFIILYSIIFGVVTKKVIYNRGYSDNWFWYGFIFGVFALIVAFSKPRINNQSNCENSQDIKHGGVENSYGQSGDTQNNGTINSYEKDVVKQKELINVEKQELELARQELELEKQELELRKRKLEQEEDNIR